MKKILSLGFLVILLGTPAGAPAQNTEALQNLSIKPLKGQSPQQRGQDSMQCAQVAKSQLEKMQQEQGQSGSQSKQGTLARGAARGAATGSLRGEIIDGDPGRGAAVGAAGGAIRGGLRHRIMEKKEKEAKEKAGKSAFELAFSTCMQERGYEVSF